MCRVFIRSIVNNYCDTDNCHCNVHSCTNRTYYRCRLEPRSDITKQIHNKNCKSILTNTQHNINHLHSVLLHIHRVKVKTIYILLVGQIPCSRNSIISIRLREVFQFISGVIVPFERVLL